MVWVHRDPVATARAQHAKAYGATIDDCHRNVVAAWESFGLGMRVAPQMRWTMVAYETLLVDPAVTFHHLAAFLDVPVDRFDRFDETITDENRKHGVVTR